MRIINQTKNTSLAERAELAHTFFKRLKGLLGRSELAPGEALIIEPCRAIHTFFMRFTIDAIFVGKENKIVGISRNLAPWRLSPVYGKAKFVVELPAGAASASGSREGDRISLAR